MDRIDALRAFAEVGTVGSFSLAARRLGISKALVSRQVAQLEEELGVRLLSRTTRRVAFTGPGAAFHARARALLDAYDEAAAEARAQQLEPRGPIKVSLPLAFGLRHLAGAILDFVARHPNVEMLVELNDRFVDLVEEGFDLGIRVGHLADSSLIARRLGEVRRIVCAAPAYLIAAGRPEKPEDLADHRCLHYGPIGSVQRWRFRRGGAEIQVPIRPAFRANNGDMLVRAARQGLGIVQMPTFIVGPHVSDGSLVPLLEEFEEPPLPVHLLLPPGRVNTAARALADVVAEACLRDLRRSEPMRLKPAGRRTPPAARARRAAGGGRS